MNFHNKVVIVTGGSSGIGAAIAKKFTKHGAIVVIVGRNSNKLTDISKECSSYGRNAETMVADVTDHMQAENVVKETVKMFGKLDILVNNAGVAGFGSILSPDAIEVFDRITAINLRAAVCLSHFAAPHLINSGGNIINMSSIASTAVLASTNFPYCTSKAGLDHFTRSIALELGSKGVRVNCINPGPVKTAFVDAIVTDKEAQEQIWTGLCNSSVLGKVCEADEVADLVLYLASDKAKSVTGSSFVIDNGVLLKGSIPM